MNNLKLKREKAKPQFKIGKFLILSCTFAFCLFTFTFLTSCARKEISTAQTEPSTISKGNNYKIGVILPLTGKYTVYGESTLHGIECASGIFSPCEAPIKAELVIKDDMGLPDKAAAAVEELATKDKVNVIIGPLSSSSIEAAARKAQELQVPLISLSQKEGVTSIGDFVFGVSLTAAAQVDTIAEWATKTKKLKTFSVFYPLNTYGQTYKQLFINAINNSKGKIVGVNSYGETTLDFTELFKSGNIKSDAIFIPDSYRAVGYIASYLPSEGAGKIQLLGVNRWNNPDLAELAGDAIEGAVFVDGFFDSSRSPSVQKFVGSFREAYGLAPTILESQGFDAARLALKALQLTGGAHAVDVRNSLLQIPEVDGSTGGISFDQNREAQKRLFLLTVKNGRIVELEGSNIAAPPKKDKYGEPVQQKGDIKKEKY